MKKIIFKFGDVLTYTSPNNTALRTSCVFIRDDNGMAVVFFQHAEWAARVNYKFLSNATHCMLPLEPPVEKLLVKTNADRIRSMSDDELAEAFCVMAWQMAEYEKCVKWLGEPYLGA